MCLQGHQKNTLSPVISYSSFTPYVYCSPSSLSPTRFIALVYKFLRLADMIPSRGIILLWRLKQFHLSGDPPDMLRSGNSTKVTPCVHSAKLHHHWPPGKRCLHICLPKVLENLGLIIKLQSLYLWSNSSTTAISFCVIFYSCNWSDLTASCKMNTAISSNEKNWMENEKISNKIHFDLLSTSVSFFSNPQITGTIVWIYCQELIIFKINWQSCTITVLQKVLSTAVH